MTRHAMEEVEHRRVRVAAAWILVVVGQGMAGCCEADPPAPEDAGITAEQKLALGNQHTCARTARGDVICWGESSSVPRGPSRGPSAVAGLCAKQISAGDRFTCASSCADQVLCWGDVPYAQRPIDRPSAVPQFPAPAIEVRAGDGHVCARDANGRLWC